MKKLLILTLVLGVASLASAALEWTSSTGSFDVNPGDDLILTLSSTENVSAVKIDLITDNGATGNITGVSVPAAFSNGQVGLDAKEFDDFLVSQGAPSQGLVAGDWAFLDAFSTTTAVSGAVLTLNYTVGAELGSVIINGEGIELLESNNYIGAPGNPMPEIALTVIPEPATLALLGLGALVLRRKK